jgi:hypothetical protein
MRNNDHDLLADPAHDDDFECLALMHLDGLATAGQQAQLVNLLHNDHTAPERLVAISDRHAQLRELGKSHADQPLSRSSMGQPAGPNRTTTRRLPFPKRQTKTSPLP